MSNIDKQALRERYSEKPTPKCDICGAQMTIQRMSGSRVTYGCSGAIYDENGCHYADGRSLADDHYEQSRVTVTDESDPDVLALLDELEAKISELQEYRKAASHPVGLFAKRNGTWLELCQGDTFEHPDGVLLYAAQPAPASVPDYPETLPCSVMLEPGLRFGKGVPTKTMLGALQRRAEYYAELEAMTPEQRAEHEAGMKEFAAMLQGAEQQQNQQQNIPENIPDGWVMVPVEPTTNQWAAGMQAFDSGMDKVTRVYKAMLGAAPRQEAE